MASPKSSSRSPRRQRPSRGSPPSPLSAVKIQLSEPREKENGTNGTTRRARSPGKRGHRTRRSSNSKDFGSTSSPKSSRGSFARSPLRQHTMGGTSLSKIAHVEDETDQDLQEPLEHLAPASDTPVKRVILKKWHEAEVPESPAAPHVAPFDLLPFKAKHVVKPVTPAAPGGSDAPPVADPETLRRENALRFHFEERPNLKDPEDEAQQAGSSGTSHHHARSSHHLKSVGSAHHLKSVGSSRHLKSVGSSHHLKSAASSHNLTKNHANNMSMSRIPAGGMKSRRSGMRNLHGGDGNRKKKKQEEETKVPFHLQGDPKRWETPEMLEIRKSLMTDPEILKQIYRLWNSLNPEQVPVIGYMDDGHSQSSSPKSSRRRSSSRRTSSSQSDAGSRGSAISDSGTTGSTPQSVRRSSRNGRGRRKPSFADGTPRHRRTGSRTNALMPMLSRDKYITKDKYLQLHYLLQRTIYPTFDEMWQAGEIQLQADYDWKQDLSRDLHKIGPQDTQGNFDFLNDDVDDDEVEDAIGRRSQTHMSRPRFFRSMFEFVDLWTETSDAHEYVAFLRNLIRRITHLRPVFIYVKQENGYAALTQLLLSTSVSGYLQASGGRRKTWNQRYIRFKGAMLQVKGTIRMSLLASIAREEKIAAEKAAEEARLAAIREEEERKQRAKNVEGAGKALFTATQLAGAYKLASGASMHDLHGLISEGAEEANKALEDALTKEAAKHDFFPDLEVVETGDEDTNNATTPEVNQTETGTVTVQEPGPGADKPLAEPAQDAEDRNVVDVVVPSNTGTDVDKNGPAADSALETGDIVDGEVIPKAESDDTDENAAATDSPKDQAVSAEKSATAAAGAEGEGGDAGDSDTEQDADDSEDGSDTFDEDASLDDEANERAQRREAQKRIRNALLDGAQTMSSSRPFARRNNLHFDWARRILCVDDPDNPSRDTAGSDSDSDEAVLGTFKLPLQKLKAPLSKLAGRRSTFVQQAATIQNRSVSCF